MHQQRPDKLEKTLQKLEIQRLSDAVLEDTSAVLDVLINAGCPLTLKEIAQLMGRALTEQFGAFVERLVMCRYLEREDTASGIAYTLRKRKPGRMPEPLIPVPYYVGATMLVLLRKIG